MFEINFAEDILLTNYPEKIQYINLWHFT